MSRKRQLVGYCPTCGTRTIHKIIQCDITLPARVFFAIISAGMSEMAGYKYHCECTKCSSINTISR